MKYLAALVLIGALTHANAGVVINEIHPNPDVATELVKFVELHNDSDVAVDLSGWRLTQSIQYTFTNGATIGAKGYAVIAENPLAMTTKFQVSVMGPWLGSLPAAGGEVRLENALGGTEDEVVYQAGFPWPTVGPSPGLSMELAHPQLDNSLGGHWRPSGNKGSPTNAATVLIPIDQRWSFNDTGANPGAGWNSTGFADANWTTGAALLYHEEGALPAAKGTDLPNYQAGRITFYFRTHFTFEGDPAQTKLSAETVLDDGAIVYLNGEELFRLGMPAAPTPVAADTLASRSVGDAAYETATVVANPSLRRGDNVIAVEVHQSSPQSSDLVWGMKLSAAPKGPKSGVGPTPGALNAAFQTNLPPAIRQVDHSPQQPKPGEPVRITAKVTDPDGVGAVTAEVQRVDPGSYIAVADAAYATNWITVPMRDQGVDGDEKAGDGVFTATLAGTEQLSRRLVRYRITATDSGGRTIRAPYVEDAEKNFAYFVYAGVPEWRGAIQPGSTVPALGQPMVFGTNVMRRLPVYHLITKSQWVYESQFQEHGDGNEGFNWTGTMVYDGRVYDHIAYRARGGVWRHAMGKNAWKFNFTRDHGFLLKDNYGEAYNSRHDKLNLRPLIQQGDYQHRGEQGMFESVSLRLFNMVGVEGSRTHWVQFRVVDDFAETGPTQYDGDFWGLYLAVEEGDGDFLKEHALPDGNFYMMGEGLGEKQNQGRTASADDSDLSTFVNTYKGAPVVDWWRTNLNLGKYYSYRTIIEAVHHYDVDDPPGKNYQYHHEQRSGLWSVHPWDLDLTWAANMYGGGNEPFRDRVSNSGAQPQLRTEFRNRVREIRDLIFNSDQMYQLIDEYANLVHGPEVLSITDADRAQWDRNPILTNSAYGVVASKGGWGLFYKFPTEQPGISNSFYGAAQLMKRYVNTRGAFLDTLATETGRPVRPVLTSLAPTNYAINRLSFRTSAFSGSGTFSAIKWRLGEVTPTTPGLFDPYAPRRYEIDSSWESPEFAQYQSDFQFPVSAAKVGHTYRARVKVKDNAGRWSNWSSPVEFKAGEADNAEALGKSLCVTELMFNPPAGNEFEFIELKNSSDTMALHLGGVKFTQGIDFTFPTNTLLAPGAYVIVIKNADVNAFRKHYGLATTVSVIGPYAGSFNNDGEVVTLRTAAGGREILSFQYGDGRGWPVAADGAGHSIVPLVEPSADGSNRGPLHYGGHWRASALLQGSPGRADPQPDMSVRINEIAAHTQNTDPAWPEYDSNDWIELYNAGTTDVNLSGYYLSDTAVDLKKWAIPSQLLPARSWVVFDEVSGFRNPITQGFGLSSAGEQLFLSRLAGTGEDRVVDAFSFKAQEMGVTLSRVPDAGSFLARTLPSRKTANRGALRSVMISEFMHHPSPTVINPEDNSLDEFVEIHNRTDAAVELFNTQGGWRLTGGIEFTFPTNTPLAARGSWVVVNFNPTNTPAMEQFNKRYGITNILQLLGPYGGKLGNDGDRIALEKPQPSSAPNVGTDWVVVDEVIYATVTAWDSGATGTGCSLTRVSQTADDGNAPAHWSPTVASPGSYQDSVVLPIDKDGDGLPDEWEVAHNLSPTDNSDAGEDADRDGLSNLAEWRAGTNPQDSRSTLRLSGSVGANHGITLEFEGVQGLNYRIEKSPILPVLQWTVVSRFAPQPTTGRVSLPTESDTEGSFFRLLVE